MDVLNPYRAGAGMSEGERVSTGPVDFVGVLSDGQLFRRNLQSAGSIGRAVPLIRQLRAPPRGNGSNFGPSNFFRK